MVVAIGAATVTVSAASAYSANKQAGKANKNQKDSQDQQTQVARDQLDFSKQQYADWKDMFGPMMGDLRDMAYEEHAPDFGKIHADVANAFDTSQDVNRRNMERVGVKPTDGSMMASETEYGMGRAMSEVGMRNSERARLADDKFNRIAGVYGLGNGMMSSALSGMQSGSAGLQNALGNQSAMYGNQAAQYSQAAQAGAQGVGYGLSQIANGWGANSASGAPSVPQSPAWGISNGAQSPWQTGYGG